MMQDIVINSILEEKLNQYHNKNAIMNQALEMYFEKKDSLKTKKKNTTKKQKEEKKSIVDSLIGIAKDPYDEESYKEHLLKKYA